ncbi:hypothetical protein ACJD0Z_15180 [Flavobacteriaceae bacterium M23B6Z8]
MNCKYCGNPQSYKRGKRNGKQRYQFRGCDKYYQDKYLYKAYEPDTNKWIVKLLKNSCGVMDVSRILIIAPKTVLSRMLIMSNQIAISTFKKSGCKYEIDEMSIK